MAPTLYTRYAYNDYGIPEAASYEYKTFEFYYQPPKSEAELERIEIYDLRRFPAGKGTNGAVPSDVITYDQNTVPEAIGFLEYSRMIVEAYITQGKESEQS